MPVCSRSTKQHAWPTRSCSAASEQNLLHPSMVARRMPPRLQLWLLRLAPKGGVVNRDGSVELRWLLQPACHHLGTTKVRQSGRPKLNRRQSGMRLSTPDPIGPRWLHDNPRRTQARGRMRQPCRVGLLKVRQRKLEQSARTECVLRCKGREKGSHRALRLALPAERGHARHLVVESDRQMRRPCRD